MQNLKLAAHTSFNSLKWVQYIVRWQKQDINFYNYASVKKKKGRHLKQELEKIYQNMEREPIKNIENEDDSPSVFSKFYLVWLHYIYI